MISQDFQNNFIYLLNGCIDVEKECTESVLLIESFKDPNKVIAVFEFGPRFYLEGDKINDNVFKKIKSEDEFDEAFLENISYDALIKETIKEETIEFAKNNLVNIYGEEKNEAIKQFIYKKSLESRNQELAKGIANEFGLTIIIKEEQEKRIKDHKKIYFNLARDGLIKNKQVLAILFGQEYLNFIGENL